MRPIACVACWDVNHHSNRPTVVFLANFVYKGESLCEMHLLERKDWKYTPLRDKGKN